MKRLWILYIIIGTGAFLTSFYLEYIILKDITGKQNFAFFLTIILESAKVLTVIFHRLIADRKDYKIPDAVSSLNTFFKFGLVFLSLTCSIAMISRGMDRPNLDSVRKNDRNLITNAFDEKISLVESRRQKRLDKITNEIKQKYQNRNQKLDTHYLPKIQKKEKQLNAEFNNVIGGIRKGPFWNEHNRQLKVIKTEYKAEKDVLRRTENKELDRNITLIETEFQKRLDNSLSNKEADLKKINKENYKNDERAKNKIVSSFLTTIDHGLGFEMEYLTFVLLFSLLISVLLESTILLTFNYVVMFYNNVLNPAEEEIVYINKENSPPEPEGMNNTEAYEDQINNENFSAQPGIDPAMEELYRNLQNQFQTSNAPKNDFDNPCNQNQEEIISV